MKNAKRIAAALVCLGLMTAVAVPAALAEREDAYGRTETEQRTEMAAPANEDGFEAASRPEGREDRVKRERPDEAAEPENAIGRDAAKEAALGDAGLSSDQVEKLRARVSDKDGTTVYKVSFRYEGQKYSYRIDPLSGEILEKTVREVSEEEAHRHGRHERPEEAAEPENAIGRDAAKEAALGDAGLSSDQVEKLRARVSDKDGTTVYKVSFRCEGQKYSYKIDPLTGGVLDKTVSEAGAGRGHGGSENR